MEKNSVYKAHRKVFLVGVMLFIGLFLVNFVSAGLWDDGLVSYYKLDETSGTIVADSLKLNNLTNSDAIIEAGGKLGTSYYFDEDADYLYKNDITGLPDKANQPRTYSAWIYRTANGNNYDHTIIGTRETSSGMFGISLNTNTSNHVNLMICKYGTGCATAMSPTPLPLNTWVHVVGTYDGTTNNNGMKLYVNGVSIANTTLTLTSMSDTNAVHTIGDTPESTSIRSFLGRIDEVGIWNRTLTQTEITALYNDGNGLPYGEGGTSPISVNLTSPLNETMIHTDGADFKVNLSITGTNLSYQWKNNTYYIWFSNGTFVSATFVNGLSTNQTNVSQNIDDFKVGKSYLWNSYACYGNTTFSNCSWSDNGNYTFQYIPFENTGESYSAATYETKNETFYLNISTISGTSNMGAFLVYNGTSYAALHTCSGTICQIWRKIDIPLMTTTNPTENKSFYWQITLFGSFGTSTSITTAHNQNVSNLIFSSNGCSPGYNATVNFTIYNETSRELINSNFKSTFNYWLGGGTVKDVYNFSGTAHNHYLFCINHNQSYITNSEIELTSGGNNRRYQFLKQIYTSTMKTQKLFIPDSVFISNVIIEVKNQGLVPKKDITVKISRYYPEYDIYEVVENKITDEFGQVVAKLIENNVIYKFSFYDSNGTLIKESDKVTVICRSSICVIPFVIEITDDYLDRYKNLSLFDYQLSFDNSTNIITYSWDDQRGEVTTYRLEVIGYKFNESTVVCNTTSTTSVSSLTCNVGSNPASYTVQVFRKVNGGNELKISSIQIIIGDYSSTFGLEGLFWVFILLMVCVGIGVYDPKVGAILYGVGFIFMGILKIIYMPLPVFFANTIIVILFVWAVKT